MRFAPVCPIHIYQDLEQYSQEAIGDYFLLLAHDVLANAEAYKAFFYNRECTKILDNSVIELGDACTPETLLEAASYVKPTCIAVPDTLQRGDETLNMFHDFIEGCGYVQYPLMFIPQGKDKLDYYRCVVNGIKLFGKHIKWIGIARNLTGRVFRSRETPIRFIHSLIKESGLDIKLHLLGFSDHIADDFHVSNRFGDIVEGIDSAVPLRYATSGVEFEQYLLKGPDKLPAIGPRNQWWDDVRANPRHGRNSIVTRKWIGEL